MPHTLVTFHAHPDDEAITTSGTMARAKAEGHRVVLVLATKGELGEYPPDFLDDGETLSERRVSEQAAAAKVIGVDRVAYLGYHDSGMDGEESNNAAHSFAQADLDEAAGRLADILREENATVLTVYDDHGGYGHPDHVQVHNVGVRAAQLAGTPRVYESTMNRDFLRAMLEAAPEIGEDAPDATEMETFGSPAEIITTTVDVFEFTDLKREAMAAHASQIPADSFFLSLAPEMFREAFRYEWYIRRDDPNAKETWVFDGL